MAAGTHPTLPTHGLLLAFLIEWIFGRSYPLLPDDVFVLQA